MNFYEDLGKLNAEMVLQFLQHPHCEVCGELMKPRQFMFFSPFKQSPLMVYECSCGFLSSDYRRFDNKLLSQEYAKYVLPNRGFNNELNAPENKFCFDDLLQFLPYNSVILDVGSGSGGLEFCNKEKKAYTVISFDVSKELIGFASSQNITVYPVDITDKTAISEKLGVLGQTKVDCIYAKDVLEHLAHPTEILQMWGQFLKDNGIVYLFLPTMDIIYCDDLAFQPRHLSYFNHKSIMMLATKSGYGIINIGDIDADNKAGTGSMRVVLKRGTAV